MNEEQINRLMMIAGAFLTIIAAVGTIALLVMCATDFTVPLAIGTPLMAAATVGFGWVTVFFGHKVTGHPLVFTNEAEREVLTNSQRRDLRRKRGEIVMERALIEIENERDNMTHRQLEAANDDTKPPHVTQWSPPKTHRHEFGEIDRKEWGH